MSWKKVPIIGSILIGVLFVAHTLHLPLLLAGAFGLVSINVANPYIQIVGFSVIALTVYRYYKKFRNK